MQTNTKTKTVCLLTLHRVEEAYGGIESFVSTLLDWLNRKGVRAVVVGRRLSILKPVVLSNHLSEKEKRNRVLRIKLPAFLYALGMLFYSFFSVLTLLGFVRREDVALIHAQDLSFAGFAGVMLSKLIGIPLITHSHGPPIYLLEKSSGRSSTWRVTERMLIRITVDNSDIILATDKQTEKIISSFVRKQTPIVVLPTAINTCYYQNSKTNEKLACSRDEIILGFLGRLTRQKNPESVIRAVANLRSSTVKLFVIGDGPLRTCLENEAKRLRIENSILFFGAVPDERKLELLKEIDIFLMPSIAEGCPIGLLEAMATGKAIIASDIPCIQEIIRDCEEAILVDPYDVEELKRAILLLCNDPDLRIKLGRRAKERAKLYDVDQVYGQILRLYREIINTITSL